MNCSTYCSWLRVHLANRQSTLSEPKTTSKNKQTLAFLHVLIFWKFPCGALLFLRSFLLLFSLLYFNRINMSSGVSYGPTLHIISWQF
jgi:hypothetical protein